jgi:hypothetical protein
MEKNAAAAILRERVRARQASEKQASIGIDFYDNVLSSAAATEAARKKAIRTGLIALPVLAAAPWLAMRAHRAMQEKKRKTTA